MAKAKKKIGYYSREYIGRGPINSFGKLGYYPVTEIVKTYDISKFNKRKRIKFEKAHFRKSVSN